MSVTAKTVRAWTEWTYVNVGVSANVSGVSDVCVADSGLVRARRTSCAIHILYIFYTIFVFFNEFDNQKIDFLKSSICCDILRPCLRVWARFYGFRRSDGEREAKQQFFTFCK